MRLLDVLNHTKAHCTVLAAGRQNNGRTAEQIGAMARYGFVRQDFSEWFENLYLEPDQSSIGALAALLIGFGLCVHSEQAYKTLILSSTLEKFLREWEDPVVHPAAVLQRIELTNDVPRDLDRSLPADLTKALYTDPAVWSFFGAYIDEGDDFSLVEIVLSRVAVKNTTILIVSRQELTKCTDVLKTRSGRDLTLSFVLEGVNLYVYYYIDR